MPKQSTKTIHKKQNENDTQELIGCILSALSEKKADDIVEMDFTQKGAGLFDRFILCTATSNTHASALCEEVIKKVKEILHIRPNHTEGESNAQWILIDYFHIIVHIFLKEQREFYDLEHLWNDTALIIRTNNI
ncbi:MAG: ribosome silencing factor [Bacteroidales bacterium]|jgi:ribosome-associated protein|nr:ribosome silencing factor [Bacteroidales bacterium]MDD2688219.1 ribosome silencing factor [Bacteroidales bacterium]MDD3330529.1 ribosome silencing factor [Bacteroidales bacterium]MDD3691953.1 ribosome silencing factor [Bacteroidales bacterium]MDD4044745.1 ribosome silencing factor [Bacteroidales bacterium]